MVMRMTPAMSTMVNVMDRDADHGQSFASEMLVIVLATHVKNLASLIIL